MPRKLIDATLENRTARSRLRVRHKPYFRLIEPGLHLGYRKLVSGPGTWIVRRYLGGGNYTVRNLATGDGKLVIADDFSVPDGHSVLSFAQAYDRAKAQRQAEASGRCTVANAMDDYIAFLRKIAARPPMHATAIVHLSGRNSAKWNFNALTTKLLETWLKNLAKRPPRLRTRKARSKIRQARRQPMRNSKRRRQASANRTWTVFKAALNRAWKSGKITSNLAWHRVAAFHDVDKASVTIFRPRKPGGWSMPARRFPQDRASRLADRRALRAIGRVVGCRLRPQ